MPLKPPALEQRQGTQGLGQNKKIRTWGNTPHFIVRRGGEALYTDEANALFERMSVQPSDTRKGIINTMIRTLKDGGQWAKLPALWATAAHTSQAARLNWKQNLFNLTPVGSPTFTVDKGYTGDGVSTYLKTDFNGATAGSQYQQNSASMGVFRLIAGTGFSNRADMGESNGVSPFGSSFVRGRGSTGLGSVQLNAAAPTATLSDMGVGHESVSRLDANNVKHYRDGLPVATVPAVSSPINSREVYLMALNLGSDVSAQWTNAQEAAFYIGGGLTDAEMLGLHNALNTYLVAIGAKA